MTHPDSVFYQPPRKVTLQLIGADYDTDDDHLVCLVEDSVGRRLRITYKWGQLENGANEPELSIKLGWTAIPEVNGFMVAAILLGRMHAESSADDAIPFIDAAKRLANREMLIELVV